MGIGTAAPGAKLHVYGSNASTPQMYIGDNVGSAGYLNFGMDDTGSTAAWIGNSFSANNAGRLDFRMMGTAASNAVMSILGSGNVGIGTTTPGQLLSVNAN